MSEAMQETLSGAREIVVDASLIFDALLGDDERFEAAVQLLELCRKSKVRLIAPASFTGEIDTAIRQTIPRRGFSENDLPAVFDVLDELPIRLILNKSELQEIRRRAREIAAMLQQPGVYDSTYAALAEAHDCTFWTSDKRFANVANQMRRKPDGTTAPALPFVKFIGD